MNLIDLRGQRFGCLTVIRPAETRNRQRYWECVCDCGTLKTVQGRKLRDGLIKSCGCMKALFEREARTKHGGCHTRLYEVWKSIKQRTCNPANKNYSRYGGRGINLCKEWSENYAAFRDWALASGYREGLSIDRIDNDGDYTPHNCRWVTMKVQAKNRHTSNKYIRERENGEF